MDIVIQIKGISDRSRKLISRFRTIAMSKISPTIKRTPAKNAV